MTERLTFQEIDLNEATPGDLLKIGGEDDYSMGVAASMALLYEVELDEVPSLAQLESLASAVDKNNPGQTYNADPGEDGELISHSNALDWIRRSGIYDGFHGSLIGRPGIWEQYDTAVLLGETPDDIDQQVYRLISFREFEQPENYHDTQVNRAVVASTKGPIDTRRLTDAGFDDFQTVHAPDYGIENAARMAIERNADSINPIPGSRLHHERMLVVAPPERAIEYGEIVRRQATRVNPDFDKFGDELHVFSPPLEIEHFEYMRSPEIEKVIFSGLQAIADGLVSYRRLITHVQNQQNRPLVS